MKTQKQLLQSVEMVSRTIKQMPHSAPSYFKRAEAYIELDKLNLDQKNRENIESDLNKAIELDNAKLTYKSTLMRYYASVGEVQGAIGIAVNLDEELKSSDENVFDNSVKRTMQSVLLMDEILKEAEQRPEIQHLLALISPYVIKVQEHEVKITQTEVKISEHDKRFEQDETQLSKLNSLITDIKKQLSSFATKKEIEEFDQQINNLVNNPDISLTLKIDNLEKKIAPVLVNYAKGYYKALESSIEITKIHNSHMIELTPYAKSIDNIISKTEGVVSNAVAMAPIVGPAVAAAISGGSAARGAYTDHRLEKRIDNLNSTVLSQHPIHANKELYLKILEGVQSKSTAVLGNIKVFNVSKEELHKMHPENSDYKATKKAKAKALDSNHSENDEATQTGLMDGYKLINNLQKNPQKNLKLSDQVQVFFEKLEDYSLIQAANLQVTHQQTQPKSSIIKDFKEKFHLTKKHNKSNDKDHKKTEPTVKVSDAAPILNTTDKAAEKVKIQQDVEKTHLPFDVHQSPLDTLNHTQAFDVNLVGNVTSDPVHDHALI